MDQEIETSQKIFQGKEFTFTIHQKPKCVVEFHLQASPLFTQTAYQKAVKAVNKQVTIPGFRKGKAPQELIIKKHTQAIEEEWKQQMANIAFPEAEALAQIPVLKKNTTINFNVTSHSLDKGSTLVFTFETNPTTPSVDPNQFILNPVSRPAVTDKEINETIRQIHFFFSTWTPVKERPVQEGDFVTLDVNLLEPPSSLFQNTRFETTTHSMGKWMMDLVIEKQLGDYIEGISTPDADLPEEEKAAFSPKKVSILIKAIETVTLPTIDDNYYQMLGVSNAEELRLSITRLLNEKADAHVREEERSQAVQFLLHQHPFDLPSSFIMDETRFRMRQLTLDPDFSEHWKNLSSEKQKSSMQAMMEQSEKSVRLFYLCNQMIREKNIEIVPEKIIEPAGTILEALVKPPSDHYIQENGNLKEAEAYSRLILEAAEDYLISQAKLKLS